MGRFYFLYMKNISYEKSHICGRTGKEKSMGKIVKTMKLRIDTDEAADRLFRELTERYASACNEISQYMFDHEFPMNFVELKNVMYHQLRDRYGLKSQMTLNAQSLNSVIKAGSGSVYTKNSMLSAVAAADGSMSLVYNESDDAASSTKYDYAGDYEDLASRFNVLSRTLYEITDTKKMNNTIIGQMYPDLNKYSKEVYVNIISTIGLEAYTKDKLGPVTTKLTGGYDKYALVAFNNSNSTSEPLIISNNDEVIRKKAHMSNDITYSFRDVDGGVIVASGDVVVKKNFSGTIIAGGTITIEGDVTVTGLSDTTDIIKTDQKYAEIFKVWNPLENSDDSGFLDVQNMTYKDMIRVANWRKRDDSEKTTQSTEAVTTK